MKALWRVTVFCLIVMDGISKHTYFSAFVIYLNFKMFFTELPSVSTGSIK